MKQKKNKLASTGHGTGVLQVRTIGRRVRFHLNPAWHRLNRARLSRQVERELAEEPKRGAASVRQYLGLMQAQRRDSFLKKLQSFLSRAK